MTTESYLGVDVGGTHTDLILARGSRVYRSKALTSHGDYSDGVLEAVSLAAEKAGLDRNRLLSETGMFVNATTLVTNVITELEGARVGVLVTKGFRDHFRFAGGARRNVYDDHEQTNPPDVVPRDRILEVEERVNGQGEVLVEADEDHLREKVRKLAEQDVEAVAVCYLWSFKNDANERKTRRVLEQELPETFVTLSSEIFPVKRETPRWLTTVFNCLSFKAATEFINTLVNRLNREGFEGRLSFFQGLGGTINVETAKKFPMRLLASGPAGGVTGSRYLAETMGLDNILVGDMGGTSFDTSLLKDREIRLRNEVSVGPLKTGINVVDVVSVGAGGGSIAWLDERGVPRVGPRSAGSDPGPVCYGQGGKEPTVTDAMVAMGYIDPENYLGGRFRLDVDGARFALERTLADPMAVPLMEAAASVHDLVVTNMANALRRVSVERGHDPREFTVMGYGGTLPLFVGQIADQLEIPHIVLPDNSSVFSAFGLLTADYVRQYNRTVEWRLDREDEFQRVNEVAEQMLEEARRDARREGFEPGELAVERFGEFRFQGQAYEVKVPLEDEPLTREDAREYAESFPEIYEEEYGEGTAWENSPVELLTYGVKVRGYREKPSLAEHELVAEGENPPVDHTREVYRPNAGTRESLPAVRETDFRPGAIQEGPAIVDAPDTTYFIPGSWEVRRDRWKNFVLTRESG